MSRFSNDYKHNGSYREEINSLMLRFVFLIVAIKITKLKLEFKGE